MSGNPVTMSDNVRGSALMLLAMASFAVGDSFLKFTAQDLPLSQILVIRGCFAILLLTIITAALGQMRPAKVILSAPFLLRIMAEVSASFFFLTALFNMPMANTIAIMQALPLTVTVGAAIFFGEPIGWRRIAAILVGLFGVLLIIQPGVEGFTIYSLWCLAAVASTTIRDLATRKLDSNIPTFFVSLVTVITVTAFGGLLSFYQTWVPVSAGTIGLLAVASLFLITGFFGIVSAMRVGEVGVVTPFRYFVLLFALTIGVFFFDEIPDSLTVIGSLIVVGSGIYTIYRERVGARKISTGTTHAAEQ